MTEHIDFFFPGLIGTDYVATCRTTGDRWYHTSMSASYTTPMTKRARKDTTTEVWRQAE